MNKYRNELKYPLQETELTLIDKKISNVLPLDEHQTIDKPYQIHSLYFDDYTNSCMDDNDGGYNERYKWRIRFYNNDLSYINLERKEKLNGLCRKLTCQISLDEYNDILNNNYSNLLYSNKKLLQLFLVDIINKGFKPKIIVDYERTAYIEPITNIRITIDKNISVSKEFYKFLDTDYSRFPLQRKNRHILEVKYDDILPTYVQQSVHLDSLTQTSFSKYYLGRKVLERM